MNYKKNYGRKFYDYFLILILLFIVYSCEKKQVKKADVKSVSEISTANNYPVKFIRGIDISKYQGDEISLLKSQKKNLKFVICKATQGTDIVDPDFIQNWENIKSENFVRGAYHFYKSEDDPVTQADFFISKISDLNKTDLPPIVDFEEGGINQKTSVKKIQMELKLFLQRVKKETGRIPIIYTDLSVGNKYLNNNYFASFPLWIAYYTKSENPVVPEIWKNKSWAFWQKSDTYRIKNYSNDFDLFNGDIEELKIFLNTY